MIAVLLLAFGCPDSIESIEPFITNVMGGRKPSPNQLQKIKERYLMIGGRSPLLDITKKQAEALEKELNSTSSFSPPYKVGDRGGKDFRVFVGMRYWHPFIKDTLNEIKNSGAERIVAVVMAPHYSKLSTGNYIKAVNEAMAELTPPIPPFLRGGEGGLAISFINNWHIHPLFLEAVAEKIKKGISYFKDINKADIQIIFSAHSLPEKDALYVKQLNETIEGIIKLTGDISWHLGFQSKGMSAGEWLEPTIDSIFERLSREGKKYVLIVTLKNLISLIKMNLVQFCLNITLCLKVIQ